MPKLRSRSRSYLLPHQRRADGRPSTAARRPPVRKGDNALATTNRVVSHRSPATNEMMVGEPVAVHLQRSAIEALVKWLRGSPPDEAPWQMRRGRMLEAGVIMPRPREGRRAATGLEDERLLLKEAAAVVPDAKRALAEAGASVAHGRRPPVVGPDRWANTTTPWTPSRASATSTSTRAGASTRASSKSAQCGGARARRSGGCALAGSRIQFMNLAHRLQAGISDWGSTPASPCAALLAGEFRVGGVAPRPWPFVAREVVVGYGGGASLADEGAGERRPDLFGDVRPSPRSSETTASLDNE